MQKSYNNAITLQKGVIMLTLFIWWQTLTYKTRKAALNMSYNWSWVCLLFLVSVKQITFKTEYLHPLYFLFYFYLILLIIFFLYIYMLLTHARSFHITCNRLYCMYIKQQITFVIISQTEFHWHWTM